MMRGTKKAFVLMPFREPYYSYYELIFKPALEAASFEVSHADDIFTPRPIMLDIQQYIVEADLILCEMSERSPNVLYELGLAHAIGKPAILVSRKEEDIPFDLRHIRVILYDCAVAGWEQKLLSSITAAAISLEDSDKVWPPPLIADYKYSSSEYLFTKAMRDEVSIPGDKKEQGTSLLDPDVISSAIETQESSDSSVQEYATIGHYLQMSL